MSRGVDVLAVLAGTIEGYQAAIPSLRGKRRDECEDGLADLKEARAAVAELIAESEKIEDSVHKLGMTCPTFSEALARVRGAA